MHKINTNVCKNKGKSNGNIKRCGKNVDISTVSRALNNKGYVHEETKKRIIEAVEELSYHPNILAKGLRQGKKHTIAFVVPRIAITIYSDMIAPFSEAARKMNYECLICVSDDDVQQEKEILERLRGGTVDGIVISSTGKNNKLIREIKNEGVCILQAVRKQDESLSSIISDYYTTGYEAVRFLHMKGCRNIGLIIGNLSLHPYKERYAGYMKAVRELELEPIVVMDESNPNKVHYGMNCADKLIDQYPALDGLLASVDTQGIGAIRELTQRGKRIPEDIRVMSLTGIRLGGFLETAMTAIEVPAGEIGETAAEIIIKDIESKAERRTVKNLVFNSTLVERETT